MFETMTSAIIDEFPQFLRKRKVLFTGFMCLLECLLGIPCIMNVSFTIQPYSVHSAFHSVQLLCCCLKVKFYLRCLFCEQPSVFQPQADLLCFCCSQGGMYLLQLMDWYSAAFSLMVISLLECIVIGWVYGKHGSDSLRLRTSPKTFLPRTRRWVVFHPIWVIWYFVPYAASEPALPCLFSNSILILPCGGYLKFCF